MSRGPVELVANAHCVTGENPLWNRREGRIYWVDIDTGRLFRADHQSLRTECFFQGAVVGGFTFQADGTLLLFESDRIAALDPETGLRRVLIEGIDPDMQRFNDVIADPAGRVFAGTIGRTALSGGLYRVEVDGSIELLWKGTGIANGMGFTGDLSRFFWTCSTTRTIFVCGYDPDTGALTERRPFYVARPTEGTPDGLSVDTEDTLWSARWDGGCVLRISSDAKVIDRIDLAVPKVSSVTFGGPELNTLYITTAGGAPGSTTEDGALFRVKVPSPGQSEFSSRVRL